MLIFITQITLFSSKHYPFYVFAYLFIAAFMYVTYSQIFKFIVKYKNDSIIAIFYSAL